jgi:hypothetical protein
MIEGLPQIERDWLEKFFGAPNELLWADIGSGAAGKDSLEAVTPWLAKLKGGTADAPIILPFYRNGAVLGWYATAATREGEQRLKATLRAWLGASYLSQLQAADLANSSAEAMRSRFGRQVLAFRGDDKTKIAARLGLLARMDAERPDLGRSEPRPVGRVRSELERALLARDEATALALIAELRGSGRLNEENLKYLDIRFKAGMAQWEQIARDHWTIKTLADLPLPPQTLADLIEALYRVYIDEAEAAGDTKAVRAAFGDRLAQPFPRLFASRHGVRTPRVVKAFILYESIQQRPDPAILQGLVDLLGPEDAAFTSAFIQLPEAVHADPAAPSTEPQSVVAAPDDAADAFDDGQYDRAFELYLATPLDRRSLSSLLACVQFIGTPEAKGRLLDAYDAQAVILSSLPSALVARVEGLREQNAPPAPAAVQAPEPAGWMRWARRLAEGQAIETAEVDVLDNRATWEVSNLRSNATLCAEFSDLIGNLSSSAADIARRSLPLIIAAFFPEGEPSTAATKPLASVVLMLIAMDEAVSRGDLETLTTVLSVLLELGLTTEDYLEKIADLEAVQDRVASFANLAWSLDVCEALAVSPTPSAQASEAKLRFFLKVVSQSRAFAHRLGVHDFLPLEYLARDYGIDPATIADLRPTAASGGAVANGPDLAGKKIGIYTLTETAGARAKAALKELFPLSIVEVNSDTVSTSTLANLARTADIFVFAWRSSSHQAFFCIKEALSGRDPTYAAGKGTASIVNAVLSAAH